LKILGIAKKKGKDEGTCSRGLTPKTRVSREEKAVITKGKKKKLRLEIRKGGLLSPILRKKSARKVRKRKSTGRKTGGGEPGKSPSPISKKVFSLKKNCHWGARRKSLKEDEKAGTVKRFSKCPQVKGS